MSYQLEAVERKIEQFINELDSNDAKMLYKALPKGKRLRAKLILIIGKNSLESVKLAAVVEMIHGASLLHDDVIDDATIRRGKPSINATFGTKTAIMFGDILYSKGFFELVDLDKRVAKIISNAVTELSLGERLDVVLSEKFNPNKALYMKMIYQKTASLIEASAEAAAILAGKEAQKSIYRVYGKNLGLAFQIIDDLLDITQDSKTLGKPAMADFKEGKTTLPYIYLYEQLCDKNRDYLISLHKKNLTKEEESWIRTQMQTKGVLEHLFMEAKILIDEAVELVSGIGEYRLEEIARKMIERSF
jgi:octaprenyl-diphosphate synthase